MKKLLFVIGFFLLTSLTTGCIRKLDLEELKKPKNTELLEEVEKGTFKVIEVPPTGTVSWVTTDQIKVACKISDTECLYIKMPKTEHCVTGETVKIFSVMGEDGSGWAYQK